MPDRKQRMSEAAAAAPNVEEIEAQTITVGREIYFPNSRKPQAVKTVYVNGAADHVTLSTEDSEWTMHLTDPVRAIVQEEGSDV